MPERASSRNEVFAISFCEGASKEACKDGTDCAEAEDEADRGGIVGRVACHGASSHCERSYACACACACACTCTCTCTCAPTCACVSRVFDGEYCGQGGVSGAESENELKRLTKTRDRRGDELRDDDGAVEQAEDCACLVVQSSAFLAGISSFFYPWPLLFG